MMRSGRLVAALMGAVLFGCGGTETEHVEETPVQVEGALVSCSASCASGATVTCTGNSCSASNNSHVQCDGVYQYCATTPPPNCQHFTGMSYNSDTEACANAIQQGTAYCASFGGVKSRTKMCLLSMDDNPYRASNYICCNY